MLDHHSGVLSVINLSGYLKLLFCGITILLGSISCSISMKIDGLWNHHSGEIYQLLKIHEIEGLWDHHSPFYQLLTLYDDGGFVGSLFQIL